MARCSSDGQPRRVELSRRRDGTQLLHETDHVDFGPVFDDLAICDAPDDDPGHPDLLARPGNAEQVSFVGSIGRDPPHHLVLIGDQMT